MSLKWGYRTDHPFRTGVKRKKEPKNTWMYAKITPRRKEERDMTIPSHDFMVITSDVSQPTAFKIPISFFSSKLRLDALSHAKIAKARIAPVKPPANQR